MTALEVILLIIGVVFFVGSFFVQEKLSKKDIEQITQLSEKEVKIILDRKLKDAETTIEDQLEEKMDDVAETFKRGAEKTSNEKIMAINEYSDTVIDSMNKTHEEIMFLYSMLNDKHTQLTDLAAQVQDLDHSIREYEEQRSLEPIEENISVETSKALEEDDDIVIDNLDEKENNNSRIISMYKDGMTYVEIAKELGLGVGQVKLVIDLSKEEM